ncbi:MAG: hypothetical protein PHH16_02185 [Candidatus Gracilibacteria bacterium]|nr:hypothetical protein [Candidatus Gracilibacteria bacterium]
MSEALQQNITFETPKKLPENTIPDFSLGLRNIADKYTESQKRNHNPVDTKDLATKQLQELTKKALSRPNILLEIYEEFGQIPQELQENPEFIAILNNGLAREYPDFFGLAQGKPWYTDGGINLSKISTLLDIIKYRPFERRKDFLDMMDGGKNNRGETALESYEKYFLGTEIGNGILTFFPNSQLLSDRKNETQQILDIHKERQGDKKGEIFDIIYGKHVTPDGLDTAKHLAQDSFINIPNKDLERLLSLLPTIESQCTNGNDIDSLVKNIDSLNIDTLYKVQFFSGLTRLAVLGNTKSQTISMSFYNKVVVHYVEQTDVTKEKSMLSEQGMQYSIISRAFSGLDKEKQEQKNKDFRVFLKRVTDEKGKIIASKKTLDEMLGGIFKDTPEADKILQDIKKSKDGKAVFKLLAEAYAEQGSQQEKALRNEGFDTEKWKKDKENKVILEHLSNTSLSTEEKMKILRNFIDPKKIPEDGKEKQEFIDKIVKDLLDWTGTTENTKTFSKESLEDFSASWKTGDFSTFNKKVQEREEKKEADEKKKQEEQKRGERINKRNVTEFIDSNSFNADFVKIDNGKVVTSYIDNNEVFIKKNTDSTVSIYSNGIPIENINISDPKDVIKDIKKAMDSIQFLQKYGLGVFRDDIPTIVELINNRPLRGGKTKIDLSDDIDPEEELILLESIAKLADIKIPEGSPTDRLSALKTDFHTLGQQNGRLTSLLRTKGYVQTGSNSINKLALEEGVKNTV